MRYYVVKLNSVKEDPVVSSEIIVTSTSDVPVSRLLGKFLGTFPGGYLRLPETIAASDSGGEYLSNLELPRLCNRGIIVSSNSYVIGVIEPTFEKFQMSLIERWVSTSLVELKALAKKDHTTKLERKAGNVYDRYDRATCVGHVWFVLNKVTGEVNCRFCSPSTIIGEFQYKVNYQKLTPPPPPSPTPDGERQLLEAMAA